MKRLFLLFSIIVGTANSFAQNTLNVHQKDGIVVSYAFSEKPVVTFTGTYIHIVTIKVEVDYPFADMEMFTFYDEANGVDVVKARGSNCTVSIYDINGTLLKVIKQDEGTASFSTSDLPQGKYIIKNGSSTYKIIKK